MMSSQFVFLVLCLFATDIFGACSSLADNICKWRGGSNLDTVSCDKSQSKVLSSPFIPQNCIQAESRTFLPSPPFADIIHQRFPFPHPNQFSVVLFSKPTFVVKYACHTQEKPDEEAQIFLVQKLLSRKKLNQDFVM